MVIDISPYTINCTGDACTGDEIVFTEAVFGGSWKKPTLVGMRTIAARIVKDSYGADKQQHTFTLEVIACDGVDPIAVGTTTRRKGRNVYKNGTMRKPWQNEAERGASLADKHKRGDVARAAREIRRNSEWVV